jgi:probable addiction module antidote protein
MKTYKIDIAAELKTKEEIDAFVAEAIEAAKYDNDPSTLAYTLGVAARAAGMLKISNETGINRAGLYRSFTKDGNPRLDTLAKVANSLGYRITLSAI